MVTAPMRFTVFGSLPGLNEYTRANRTNHRAGARMKRESEIVICGAIRGAGMPAFVDPVFVTFGWIEPNQKRDADNVAFAKKFILDALVRTGVLAGDGRRHVVGFRDLFDVDRTNPRVVVTITRMGV